MKKRLYAAILIVLALALPFPQAAGGWSPLTDAVVWAEEELWSYRSQLSEQEAELYDDMSTQFQEGNPSFTHTFPAPLEFENSQEAQNQIKDMFFRAYEAFYRDHPQVFWINKPNITISPKAAQGTGKVQVAAAEITVTFTNISDLPAKQDQLEEKVQSILKGAGNNDFEKVWAFHDYLTNNCQYDEPAAATPANYPLSYESYGALIYGNATCEGYSKAFKLLCDRAGIPCVIIGGNAGGEAHMWNYVKLDGAWYMVDSTFDDPIGGEPRYDYFLKGKNSTAEYKNENSFTQNFDPRFNDPVLSQEDYPLPDMSKKPEVAEDAGEEAAAEANGPCRVSFSRAKNGTLSVEYTYASGSLDNGQTVPNGIVLRVVAFPQAGYELDAVTVDMGGSVKTVDKEVFYLTVTADCQVSAAFTKKAG